MFQLIQYEFQKIIRKKVAFIGIIVVLILNLFMFNTIVSRNVFLLTET